MSASISISPTADPRETAEVLLAVRGMTCAACAYRVRGALMAVEGVTSVEVDLRSGRARVGYESDAPQLTDLCLAVRQAGYEALEAEDQVGESAVVRGNRHAGPFLWPALIGTVASVLLAALYVAVVTIAQSWSHALELVASDWYFVVAIAAGFGIQVGLFVYMRQCRKGCSTGSSKAVTGLGTGTSTVGMLACCAHHASDVMPLLGLTGATVFLTDNRVPFMVLGIASNAFGVLFMLRALRRQTKAASSARTNLAV